MFSKIRTFISRELQLIHKITISKVVLCVSENYNQEMPNQGKNQNKGKKKKKEKEKREKRGGDVEHEERALKNSKHSAPFEWVP